MGLSPWKCWRLWQRQMSPLSVAGPSESPWSDAACQSSLPFLLHEQSLEPQEEGSGGPGWKHHDDCEHKRSRQWQKLNWIRLNHTIKGFMQLHFCISVTPFLHFWNVYQHLWNVYQQKDPTDLLWCKTRDRHSQGGPTDLLWCKKRDRHSRGGPNRPFRCLDVITQTYSDYIQIATL